MATNARWVASRPAGVGVPTGALRRADHAPQSNTEKHPRRRSVIRRRNIAGASSRIGSRDFPTGAFDHGSAHYTDVMKTEPLRKAFDAGRQDTIFGGARRDEERSRARERVVSLRSAGRRRDPMAQRPEIWNLYNVRVRPGSRSGCRRCPTRRRPTSDGTSPPRRFRSYRSTSRRTARWSSVRQDGALTRGPYLAACLPRRRRHFPGRWSSSGGIRDPHRCRHEHNEFFHTNPRRMPADNLSCAA